MRRIAAYRRRRPSTDTRPFSDTDIAEQNGGKRSLYVRANRATTAGRLTPMGYAAYCRPGAGGPSPAACAPIERRSCRHINVEAKRARSGVAPGPGWRKVLSWRFLR